jgi:hypothetical protein
MTYSSHVCYVILNLMNVSANAAITVYKTRRHLKQPITKHTTP